MIKPVNGHLLIDPIAHEDFMASQRDTYQEIGTVVELDAYFEIEAVPRVRKGDKVYFDAWLAAKYPKEGSREDYYWLVKWDDVRAIETSTVVAQA